MQRDKEKLKKQIGGIEMSVEQYQRAVNTLDKEIADLEKKKAVADKKSADEQKRAASISVSKNASAATVKSKMNEIQRHEAAARKADEESANIQKKIAEKRLKRNEAYLRLQKEQQDEQKKEQKAQQQRISNMQRLYENRIADLERQALPTISTSLTEDSESVPEYDVFISHAWEDKGSFADEFVDELRKLGINVWYDTSQIRWGDSMRQRIDDGLKKSKFGVVILSPNYIAEGKYWTKAELDGLFQLESVRGKTLLPIWHDLTKKQVMEFSPIIANKKAMTTASMTAQEIAVELANLLPDTEESENGQTENGNP